MSTTPKNLTDSEREYFVGRIHDLERRLRRWRLMCLVLLGLLMLPVVLGGLLGVWWVPRLESERAKVRYSDNPRERVEQLLSEAERERAVAEEEARRRAQQGPEEDKEEKAHASR